MQEIAVKAPRDKIPTRKFHASATAPRMTGVSPMPMITPMAMVVPAQILRSLKVVSLDMATRATGKNAG